MQTSASPEEFLNADLAFHLAISTAAHNAIFMNALHLIRNLMREWIRRTIGLGGVLEVARGQHREILTAIEARDVAAARAAMANHLNEMGQYLMSTKPPSTAEFAAQN